MIIKKAFWRPPLKKHIHNSSSLLTKRIMLRNQLQVSFPAQKMNSLQPSNSEKLKKKKKLKKIHGSDSLLAGSDGEGGSVRCEVFQAHFSLSPSSERAVLLGRRQEHCQPQKTKGLFQANSFYTYHFITSFFVWLILLQIYSHNSLQIGNHFHQQDGCAENVTWNEKIINLWGQIR